MRIKFCSVSGSDTDTVLVYFRTIPTERSAAHRQRLRCRLQRNANPCSITASIHDCNITFINNKQKDLAPYYRLGLQPNIRIVDACQNTAVLEYFFFHLFMAALCNRGAIIFLPCSFYLLSIFLFFFLA